MMASRASHALAVLLHSPLVGPLTWHAVAERLSSEVADVVVPNFRSVFLSDAPFNPKIAAVAAAAVYEAHHNASIVLVGHSMGGLLIPSVMQALERPVAGAIFVDSALPQPGTTWFDQSPPTLAEQLRALAEEGQLPPWYRWFPEELLTAMVPNADLRKRFTGEVPNLPLSYFEEPFLGLSTGADQTRCGYILLSEPYETAADAAEEKGWPVTRLNLHHLAIMTEPEEIVTALRRVLNRMGLTRSS
jgi:pimeloyl-ACP methyl ester carboxylesterase